MGKLAALMVLIAVAFIVYFFSPSPVEVVSKETDKQISKVESKEQTKTIKSLNNQQTTSQASGHIDSDDAEHSHQHPAADSDNQIPQYIRDELESKRIPASELTVQEHPDGSSSIDLKGQFQHVPVAILGEDGKVKIVETRIEPKTE